MEQEIKDYNYAELANAVILQAVQDYKKASRELKRHPNNQRARWDKEQILCFFKSRLFKIYTDLDADELIKKLDEEVD